MRFALERIAILARKEDIPGVSDIGWDLISFSHLSQLFPPVDIITQSTIGFDGKSSHVAEQTHLNGKQ